MVRIDPDRVGGGDAARREVGATQEEQFARVGVTAHHEVADEVDLILEGHLWECAIDAEGTEDVARADLVDGDLTRAEGEVTARGDADARVDERAAGVVVAVA